MEGLTLNLTQWTLHIYVSDSQDKVITTEMFKIKIRVTGNELELPQVTKSFDFQN